MKPNEFLSTYNEIIEFNFENAVEVSLKEVVNCKVCPERIVAGKEHDK